jgi:protein arginine kinase activator
MKCRNCTKPATLHITEVVKGAAQELHLCEECAREYLSSASAAKPGDPIADGSMDESPDDVGEESTQAELDHLDKLVCPTCEQTFRDFRNQGRLGCPHCYEAFHDELIPLLENIHGETQHLGKMPRRAPDDSQKHFRLIKLRNDLRSAVAEESYEEAARLRDEIQALESELHRPV